MSIKVIFFDTNDTLYQNEGLQQAHAQQPIIQLAEKRGIPLVEAEALFKDTKEALKGTLPHVTKVAVMIELGIPRIEMQEFIAELNASDYLSQDPKLREVLTELKKGFELGIITNIMKKAVIDILSAMEIDEGVFTHYVTVDNTSKSKPDEEPFLKAIELAGCLPEECVYVADSLTKDIIPAKKVGMKTIWINETGKRVESADQVVKHIHDVANAIKKVYNEGIT